MAVLGLWLLWVLPVDWAALFRSPGSGISHKGRRYRRFAER